LVIEPAKVWNGLDATYGLDNPVHWRVFAQREMGPDLIVIVSIGMQHVPEMAFAKYHDMIETVPPDRADETFAGTVLPRGSRSCRSVLNAYRPEPAFEDIAVGTVPVTDEVAWCAVPTHSFGELPGDPFC
jgi:hypothetical protein